MSEETVDRGTCDVCHCQPAIGVASTIMPLSVAYCRECATRGAQPEIVFLCIVEDIGTDFDKLHEGFADQLTTFKDGRYMSYREWATQHQPRKQDG